MCEIHVRLIEEKVSKLCIQACCELPADVERALKEAEGQEESSLGRKILADLRENSRIACQETVPLCQDTGMVVVFVKLGQDVRVIGGGLTEAINKGIARGYLEGSLRKSVVADPLDRKNTGNNTPAVIYYDLVPGENLQITVMPKGFGSENCSALAMLKPAQGRQGVKDFVIGAVDKAGANPCPPVIVGVGLGGTADKALFLAKRALLRPLGSSHQEPFYACLEKELLKEINDLGYGPGGFGGRITALAVHIEVYPTHIAGLPVAVNINCHAARHKTWVWDGEGNE